MVLDKESYQVSDLNRHWLVWLKENSGIRTDFSDIVSEWIKDGKPFVCARFDENKPGTINLGICYKDIKKEKPLRISVSTEISNLLYFRPPMLLSEAIQNSSRGIREELLELQEFVNISGIEEPSIFGSCAWQALMINEKDSKYVSENSDLDLTVEISSFEEICLYGLITDILRKSYKRKIDCEIYYQGTGFFSLNEFFSSSKDILIKQKADIFLMNKKSLYEIIISETYFSNAEKFTFYSVKNNKERISRKIAIEACRALFSELICYPKPGLVSFFDSGSHSDMDYSTFLKSIHSLYYCFNEIAMAVFNNSPFSYLEELGRNAEKKMYTVTDEINTHKGVIFSLGLIIAALTELIKGKWEDPVIDSKVLDYDILQYELKNKFREKVLSHAVICSTHGRKVRCEYGCDGIIGEAADGFPVIFNGALPEFIEKSNKNKNWNAVLVQTFFKILSLLKDTNILFRGQKGGLEFSRDTAEEFLKSGGTLNQNWYTKVQVIHQSFIEKKLSPGGCADMLACTVFIYRIVSIFGDN